MKATNGALYPQCWSRHLTEYAQLGLPIRDLRHYTGRLGDGIYKKDIMVRHLTLHL